MCFYETVLRVNEEQGYNIKKGMKKLQKSEFRIVTEQARYPLSNLEEIFKDHILRPKYQRLRVWDNKRKSRLIESFLINIPVPSIFLYEIEYSQYEVMDGQQRVSTILEFFADEFSLDGLEFFEEYNGKKYSEIPEEMQRSIARRYLSATILLKETAKNIEEEILMKQLIFERLNTGGIALTPQEIRNALYPSKFNELLFELAEEAKFRNLWNFNEESNQRMEDCELILRFFAYISAIKVNISKSIQGTLDMYMQQAVYFNEKEVDILRQLFVTTVNKVYEVFGKDAFKSVSKTRKREKMIYDAVMLLVHQCLLDEKILKRDANRKKYEILAEHKDIFNGKYTAIRNVKERVDIMKKNLVEG